MNPTADSQRQLLALLFSAASFLVESITDPVVVEQAPLRQRVSALNAVNSFIGRIHKLDLASQAAPLPPVPSGTEVRKTVREAAVSRPSVPRAPVPAVPTPKPASVKHVSPSVRAAHPSLSRTSQAVGPLPCPGEAPLRSAPLATLVPGFARQAPHRQRLSSLYASV